MAKYRLTAPHVTKDAVLIPAGTEVGDGTAFPWEEPTLQMAPLDEDAKKRIDELHQRVHHRPGPEVGGRTPAPAVRPAAGLTPSVKLAEPVVKSDEDDDEGLPAEARIPPRPPTGAKR